jgi:hypothetical protein
LIAIQVEQLSSPLHALSFPWKLFVRWQTTKQYLKQQQCKYTEICSRDPLK